MFQYKAKGGTVREYPIVEVLQDDWIPVSERVPEEREWDDGYVEPSDSVDIGATEPPKKSTRIDTQIG